MSEYTSKLQKNQGWNLTWSALDRYPMIAKRRFNTLEEAQSFVDDIAPGASATEGIVITVINDDITYNNGIYYVSKVANDDEEYGAILDKGELVKVADENELKKLIERVNEFENKTNIYCGEF